MARVSLSTMGDYERMVSGDMNTWSAEEVGMWLEYIGFAMYKDQFVENCIQGEELLEIDTEDLVILGVKSLGHRKQILKEIRGRSGRYNDFDDNLSDTGSSFSSVSTARSTSNQSSASTGSVQSASGPVYKYNPEERIKIKFVYKDDISVVQVTSDVSLKKLERKARKEYGIRMTLAYKDTDGDLIHLKRQKNVSSMFRHQAPPIRLVCTAKKRSASSRSTAIIPTPEIDLLASLSEAAVVVDALCRIVYMNPASLKMWGYTKEEAIGQNVKILMPASYARRHDRIVADYIAGKTEPKIIGQPGGRLVMGKHSNGSTFPIQLTVTETKEGKRHTFTATITLGKESERDNAAGADASDQDSQVATAGGSRFNILDMLLECACVINSKGNILFFNNKACEFFGYQKEEVIGQNVSILMPSPYKENHDSYLANYMKTRVKRVLGRTRGVLCEKKDGTVTKILLSVNHSIDPATGDVEFTGMLRPPDNNELTAPKSALRQERDVVNNLLVPGIIIDQECRVQAFNRSASKLFGYELPEVLGQNVNIIVGAEHRDLHDGYVDTYLRTGVKKAIGKERVVVGRRKDGVEIKVKLSITAKTDPNGGKQYFTGMIHTI